MSVWLQGQSVSPVQYECIFRISDGARATDRERMPQLNLISPRLLHKVSIKMAQGTPGDKAGNRKLTEFGNPGHAGSFRGLEMIS